ncbi:MAG: hypothetical protein ACRCU3_08960 [Eubacteriaceae bacterium]
MKKYIIIAGVNGVGKSSYTGAIEPLRDDLGETIDVDKIAKEIGSNFEAGKIALSKMKYCLDNGLNFTQETTLMSNQVFKTVKAAYERNFFIELNYIGLDSAEKSIQRIENRVFEGGHHIDTQDVIRRFNNRFKYLKKIIPYCNKVEFYDNKNGFAKVAEVHNRKLIMITKTPPLWLGTLEEECFSYQSI